MRPYRDTPVAAYRATDEWCDKRGIPAALAIAASEDMSTPTVLIRHGLQRGSQATPTAYVAIREHTPRMDAPMPITMTDDSGRTVVVCPQGPELRSWSHQRVRGNGGVRTAVQHASTPETVYSVRVQRTERDTARKPSRRAALVASAAELGASLEAAMVARDTARAMAVRAELARVQREVDALPALPSRAVVVVASPEQANANADAARHAREQTALDRSAALVAASRAPAPARDWRGADK